MEKTIEYKGYCGSVAYSEEDGCFYGSVLNTQDLVSYEGTTKEELVADFHEAVEAWLSLCMADEGADGQAHTKENKQQERGEQ